MSLAVIIILFMIIFFLSGTPIFFALGLTVVFSIVCWGQVPGQIIFQQTVQGIDSFGMLGDDGTPVGITGGSGFSPYPSIPRITSKQIDSKTDSEGKLNVKITVSTEETLVKEEKPEEGTGEDTTGE